MLNKCGQVAQSVDPWVEKRSLVWDLLIYQPVCLIFGFGII